MSDSPNPPRGDFQKAEKYINQLVDLINKNKIQVTHTDLKRFDPTTLQDHYTVGLSNYHIEISHSKQPNNGKDSYVCIFNNLKQISEGSGEKVILAYIYLDSSQFSRFKMTADRQIEEKRRAEEEKRFNEVLAPVDELLDRAGENNLQAPQSNISNNPLMQSFKKDFQDNLNDSLEKTEKPAEDYSQSQIHQI
jgi:hypothetical protein